MRDYAPLHKKLQLHKYERKAILRKPEDVEEFEGIDYDTDLREGLYDLILIFVMDLDEMAASAWDIAEKNILREKGYLYLAYPKKGNKKYSSYIDRDSIFPKFNIDEDDGYLKDTSLKFSRMVSLNETFTIVGLKKEERGTSRPATVSQRVADYESKVKEVEELLAKDKEALTFYQALTPGYQKDWARHIFSSRTEATRQKRVEEAITLLKAGYKTKAHARKK